MVATGLDQATSLRLPQTSGTPQATENVSLELNLSANATIPANASRFDDAHPYAFDRFDPGTYNQSSQTTIYDANGSALTMTNYYVRETSPTPSDQTSSWKVYSFVGDQQLDADTATAGAQPITLQFDSTGTLTAPTGPTTFGGFLSAGATAEQPRVRLGAAEPRQHLVGAVAVAGDHRERIGVGDHAGVEAAVGPRDHQLLGGAAAADPPCGTRLSGDRRRAGPPFELAVVAGRRRR